MFPGSLSLFKSLFRGREDIFAIRWEKNGKSGYFPAYDYDRYQFRLHKIKGGTIQTYPDKQLSGQADSVDHLELGYICRRLKELSRELDLPILAVSQLNRTVEYRGGTRRPELTDLRDSGHIELEADKVLMLYRPEYYHIDADEEGNSTKYLAELSLQRNQTGKNGYVYLKRDQEFTRFSELPFTVQLKNDIQADIIVPASTEGKISFVGFVRGREDSIYLRFQKELKLLESIK